jgi:hypothetical protein
MKTITRALSLAALALAPLAAAHAMPPSGSPRCGIVEPTRFISYVEENKPTLVELKTNFSCLAIIMPGQATTMEYRHDNSRFHAKADEYGRIVGGHFN